MKEAASASGINVSPNNVFQINLELEHGMLISLCYGYFITVFNAPLCPLSNFSVKPIKSKTTTTKKNTRPGDLVWLGDVLYK